MHHCGKHKANEDMLGQLFLGSYARTSQGGYAMPVAIVAMLSNVDIRLLNIRLNDYNRKYNRNYGLIRLHSCCAA